MKRAISYLTYKRFAKKYKIPLSYKNSDGKRKLKNMEELSKPIYHHEMLYKIINGLYF